MSVFFLASAAVVTLLATQVVARGDVGTYEDPNVFLYFRVVALLTPVLAGLFAGVSSLSQEFEQGTFRFSFTQAAGARRWVLANVAIVLMAAFVGLCVLGIAAQYFTHKDSVVRQLPDWSIASTFTNPLVLVMLGLFVLSASLLVGLAVKKNFPALAVALGSVVAFYSSCYLWLYQKSLHFAAIANQTSYLARPPRHSYLVSALVHDSAGNQFAPIWSPTDFAKLAQSRHFTFWLEYVPANSHAEFVAWWSVALLAAATLSAIAIAPLMRHK